ncbi:MAG: glutamate racemase [Bariatricus sp.]|nr:glutamate racemase [Bariatricus sp.]
MKVGIFDSGIGGLSVLHRARKMMPDVRFVYYSDVAHVPYGEKTVQEIRGFVEHNLNFLIDKEVDAVVIACNTATTVATKEFRAKFPVPIVGMEPAVKKAIEQFQNTGKRILVAATPVTIAGEKLHNLLERVDKEHDVDLIPLPKLVHFAESGNFDSEEIDDYLREELKVFHLEDYAAVVLGCTHFNYFKENFLRIFPNEIHFVDGNEGTLRQLMRLLPQKDEKCTEDEMVQYYFSGIPAKEEQKKQIECCMKRLDKMYELV